MNSKKVKIVLDTDVVLHFIKGEKFSLLLDIFAGQYDYVILSTTYEELRAPHTRAQIDNHVNLLKNLKRLEFNPTGEMRRVYATLREKYGKGESACMAYCQFEHDIVGSNNTRDIREYCTNNGIAFLTTADFLYYAVKKGKLTEAQAQEMITMARNKGSHVPYFNYSTHHPSTTM